MHGLAREARLRGNQHDLGTVLTEFMNLVVALDAFLMVSIVPFLEARGASFVPGWDERCLLFRKRL